MNGPARGAFDPIWEWLDFGPRDLGIGAKNAAGYGHLVPVGGESRGSWGGESGPKQ